MGNFIPEIPHSPNFPNLRHWVWSMLKHVETCWKWIDHLWILRLWPTVAKRVSRLWMAFGICPDLPTSAQIGGKNWVPMRCSPLCEGSPAPRTGSPGSKPAWENRGVSCETDKLFQMIRSWENMVSTPIKSNTYPHKIQYISPKPCYFHSENLRNAFCIILSLPVIGFQVTLKLRNSGEHFCTRRRGLAQKCLTVDACKGLWVGVCRSVLLDLEVNHHGQWMNLVVDTWHRWHQEFSSITHVEMVELPVSILHAVKNELENSPATNGY